MTSVISANTQAILLLTAPLIAGRNAPSEDLLSPGEYKRLARHLREMQRKPSDFFSTDASDVLRACQSMVDQGRLQRLLERGFLMSQCIERWQALNIWVISRADADYPRRLKLRLRDDAPAVIYGCGDLGLIANGGLAVVGSRHVDESLIEYAEAIGALVAHAGRAVISGGAKGVDQAAMRGALEAGGRVGAVLADGLEKAALNRANRHFLLDRQLVLMSSYDPSSGFNVGNAMQRNKLIYASSDAALVVSAELNKGGTWAGATEQLDKLKAVPVYVRSTGDLSAGMNGLLDKGAVPWPNPYSTEALDAVFDPVRSTGKIAPYMVSSERNGPARLIKDAAQSYTSMSEGTHTLDEDASSGHKATVDLPRGPDLLEMQGSDLAGALFSTVREVMLRLLAEPMSDIDVATTLAVSQDQAKSWLQRLIDEGVVEKQKTPVAYVVKQSNLFR
jgi:DNA processing protein